MSPRTTERWDLALTLIWLLPIAGVALCELGFLGALSYALIARPS